MSDIKLFDISDGNVRELRGSAVAVEQSLQRLLEHHLETFLGVRFLDSEHSTGRVHGGRIDTLGLDENGSPVIIEYKRSINENVINQGLFYLDWLLDHKAEFELLVINRLGREVADTISWAAPRVLCIAGDFTRYDTHAVQQIGRNIELLRYKVYGEDHLILELVNTAPNQIPLQHIEPTQGIADDALMRRGTPYKTVSDYLAQSPQELQDRLEALKAFLLSLGDDVQMFTLRTYFAFRRIRNFACVVVQPAPKHLVMWVKVDPKSIILEEGFTCDVTEIGHQASGNLEITLRTADDLQRAEPLLRTSYDLT